MHAACDILYCYHPMHQPECPALLATATDTMYNSNNKQWPRYFYLHVFSSLYLLCTFIQKHLLLFLLLLLQHH